MLCPHGIDPRVCATCAAEQRPHHEARPSPTETFADNMAECAYDPSHFVYPGERVRYLDGLGWSCTRCAPAPATLPLDLRAATTANKPPRSRTKAAALASIIAVGLLVVGFVAVSWLNASADAKFAEVDSAIEADGPGTTAAAALTEPTPQPQQTAPATSAAPPPATTTPVHIGYTEEDTEWKLRTLDAGHPVELDDPTIHAYAGLLDILEAQCTEDRALIGDMAVTAQEMVDERAGVEIDLIDLLLGIRVSIPDGAPEMSCSDLFAAWATLVIDD